MKKINHKVCPFCGREPVQATISSMKCVNENCYIKNIRIPTIIWNNGYDGEHFDPFEGQDLGSYI
jgi:hypothetical protein